MSETLVFFNPKFKQFLADFLKLMDDVSAQPQCIILSYAVDKNYSVSFVRIDVSGRDFYRSGRIKQLIDKYNPSMEHQIVSSDDVNYEKSSTVLFRGDSVFKYRTRPIDQEKLETIPFSVSIKTNDGKPLSAYVDEINNLFEKTVLSNSLNKSKERLKYSFFKDAESALKSQGSKI